MIEIVTALIRDARGHVLLVRKANTRAFMQPGGKREPGEDDLAALRRELREELGADITVTDSLGLFQAPAANEPGRTIRAATYAADLHGEPDAAAEIAEWRWIDPAAPGDLTLAPLTRDVILPLARNMTSARPPTDARDAPMGQTI